MDSGIVSALIGLGGALIGGGLTSGTTLLIDRGNRSRFSRERVWDERRGAYTKIIAAVADIKRQADEIAFNFSDEAGGEKYYGSPALIAASTTRSNLERQLDRVVSNNRIILSTEMWRWHTRLQTELEEIADNRDQLDEANIAAAHRDLYEGEMHAVVAIAQRELGVTE